MFRVFQALKEIEVTEGIKERRSEHKAERCLGIFAVKYDHLNINIVSVVIFMSRVTKDKWEGEV